MNQPSPAADGRVRGFDWRDIQPRTLAFRDIERERRFRAHSRADNLRQARIACLLAAALNLPFALLDPLIYAEHARIIMWVRLVGVSVLFLGVFALTFLDYFRTRWPVLMLVLIWGFSLFYTGANVIGDVPVAYAFGFHIAIAAFYALIPLIFMYCVSQAWLATAVYFVAMVSALEMSRIDALMMAGQFAVMNVIGMVVLYRRELAQRRDFANLEAIAEQGARNRRLLRRILPESVADRLEAGEPRIADAYEDAGVLFADIENFTRLSAGRSPDEVVRFLDGVFARFDRRVADLGLEKIKTIGDAYMVAGGAPGGGGARLEALARLALGMREDVAGLTAPDGAPVRLHVGLHAGPVAAGVVGDSRFLYDLWGDTVNIASRMAGLGEGAHIHVTQQVRSRLGSRFRFTARGEIEVRGRGRLPVWTLDEPSGEASPGDDAPTGGAPGDDPFTDKPEGKEPHAA